MSFENELVPLNGVLCICALISGIYVATSEHAFGYQDGSLLCQNLLLLSLGAILAFMLEMAEFLVVSHASGLTLSVAGIFKVQYLMLIVCLRASRDYTWCSRKTRSSAIAGRPCDAKACQG